MNYSKLIFVYNADSGILNAVKDAVHKTFKPQTYGCNLCAVTFGPVFMKSEWRRFIENLPVPVEFLHRDEFTEQYGADGRAFPAVFALERADAKNQNDTQPATGAPAPSLLVPKEMIDDCRTVSDLEELIDSAL